MKWIKLALKHQLSQINFSITEISNWTVIFFGLFLAFKTPSKKTHHLSSWKRLYWSDIFEFLIIWVRIRICRPFTFFQVCLLDYKFSFFVFLVWLEWFYLQLTFKIRKIWKILNSKKEEIKSLTYDQPIIRLHWIQ